MPAGYDQLMIPVIDNIPMLIVVLLITLPVAMKNIRSALAYYEVGLPAIASLDEATAKLQLFFSLTLITGLLCATMFT